MRREVEAVALSTTTLDLTRRIGAVLARWLIQALSWTYRPTIVTGGEVLERIVAGNRPVIFCFWHEGIVFFAPVIRQLRDRGVPVTVFTSLSRDGELVALLSLAWGADVVRGSSSRGGTEALRQLLRAVRSGGSSPVIIPDGPRGPRRTAKSGAVMLARMSGRPCVLLACAARKGWRLPTWDRLLVPRPFTQVAIAVADPFCVPGDESTDVGAYRLELERTLDALEERAAAAFGRPTD